MEVLALVGVIVKYAVWGGYTLSAGFGVATLTKYVHDYKESIEKEKSTN
jgi:hypothetical protein